MTFMPLIVLDSILIKRRRRINNVTGFYPEVVYLSKKKSKDKYCVVRFPAGKFMLMAAGVQYIFCYYYLRRRGDIPILNIESEYFLYEFSYSFRCYYI